MNRHAPEQDINEDDLQIHPPKRSAAYFPEANALVHRELVARGSNTPGYKAMTVRFVRHGEAAEPKEAMEAMEAAGTVGI